MKTIDQFKFDLIPRNPAWTPPMMTDDVLYHERTKRDLVKITAPDGTWMLTRRDENYLVWDGFSDEASDLMCSIPMADQFAAIRSAKTPA
jgi:hypothetical protein